MESLCWISACSLLIGCVWAVPPRYSVHRQPVNFDTATKACYPGALTTLATEKELAAVLSLISQDQDQDPFTFWIGLRIVKEKCVEASSPLRGFSWVQDNSEESEVSRWAEEPEPTCLSDRCGVLRGVLNMSQVADWGLAAVKCKSTYQYICKTRGGFGTQTAATASPAPEPSPKPRGQDLPRTEPPGQESEPEPQQPEATGEESEPETYGPELQPEPKPESQTPLPLTPYSEHNLDLVHSAGLDPGSDPDSNLLDPPGCKKPHVPRARFLSQDPEHPFRLWVECWPGQRVQILCSGRPHSWHLLNGSPANFSSVCRPCDRGFYPDGAGNCVDVDECEGGGAGGRCIHGCVNTMGSYRCTCLDQNGQLQEDLALCSGSVTLGYWRLFLLLLLLLP